MAKLAEVFQKGQDSINKAGGPAFALGLKERFATRLMTCLVGEPKYYGDTTQELVDETKALCFDDPEFVLKAAIYAREQMNLRTAPVLLIRWLAPHLPSSQMEMAIPRICTRPDQLADLHAYYLATQDKRTLSKGMKLGVRAALSGYSTYQLAKYPKGLVALIKTTHPARREEFQALIENRSEAPYTWEVELTRHGNNQETWDKLLAENAVGYMALLRNLRNILANASKHVQTICDKLTDPEQIKNSKQFPFRYLAALRALQGSDVPKGDQFARVIEALGKAFELSAENLPKMPGTTVFIMDHSGSMSGTLSDRGSISYMDTADTLAIMGATMCDAAIPVAFGSSATIVEVPSEMGTLQAVDAMKQVDVGHSTNLPAAFELLREKAIQADRIIVLSDMQSYRTDSRGSYSQESSQLWRAAYGQEAWIHSIDLAGYGTTQIRDDNVSLIAGWSDKILNLIPLIEQGGSSFIQAIENVQLTAVLAAEEDEE